MAYNEIERSLQKRWLESKKGNVEVEYISFIAYGNFEEIQDYLKPCEYDNAVIGINKNGEIIIMQNVGLPSRNMFFSGSKTTVNPYGTSILVVNIAEMTLEIIQKFTGEFVAQVPRRQQGIEAAKKNIIILQHFDNDVYYDDKNLYGEFSIFIKNSDDIEHDADITNEQIEALKKVITLNNLCKFSLTIGPYTVIIKEDYLKIIDALLNNKNSKKNTRAHGY